MAVTTESNVNSWVVKQCEDTGKHIVGSPSTLITELDLQLKLLDVSYASFITTTKLTMGTYHWIRYLDIQDVFFGRVTQCTQLNNTSDGKSQYDIEITEPAADLSNKYMTSDSISGIYVLNTNKLRTLGSYINIILSGSADVNGTNKWYDGSDEQFKNVSEVPALAAASTDLSIPAMGFSVCSIWSALQRLVVNIFDYGLWFKYDSISGTRKIRYGDYNNDVTLTTVPVSIKIAESNINYTVDGVVVYNDDKSMRESYPTNITPNHHLVCYVYSGCQSKEELRIAAVKIYNDRKDIKTRYTIVFPITQEVLRLQEGDRLHISNPSIGMVSQTDGYGVKDIRIQTNQVVVGVGAASMTIFDILSDRLSVIDGDVVSYNTIPYDIGVSNVFCGATSSPYTIEKAGDVVTGTLNIEGKQFFGGLTFTPTFGVLGAIGNGFTAFVTAGATSNLTITSEKSYFNFPLPTSWFEPDGWSWQWCQIDASYIFSSSNSTGATVQWDCEWVDLTILDDATTLTSSSVRRTLNHQWFVGQYDNIYASSDYNIPDNYPLYIPPGTNMSNMDLNGPIISVYHNNAIGTNVKILDADVRLTIYYVASGGDSQEFIDTFEGKIWMRISTLKDNITTYNTGWIVIYDSENIDLYFNSTLSTWKTYKMGEGDFSNITIDNFAVGNHTVEFKLSGTTDAAVTLIGQYLSFDQLVSVVKTGEETYGS